MLLPSTFDKNCSQEQSQQVLVRFQDETTVLCVQQQTPIVPSELLSRWSSRTGWPLKYLQIQSWQLPFVTIRVCSGIRGGKGGFGTLLKGQARQAGAKLTTDFGACRDLQGRRLRHVNDEIKLRKWREMKQREQAGEKVPDDELWKTPSGIYNWHLMTPTWADVSKKATYRIKRQFQQLDKEAQKAALLKQEQDAVYKNSVNHYLQVATSTSESIHEAIPDAIKQGLLAAANNKKRKRAPTNSLPLENAKPNSLVTLSGDIVMEETSLNLSGMKLQSQSDFATAVLVLDRMNQEASIVYYEVTLVTGGLAQIGWACLMGDSPFEPNNDLGDGVGDDPASFGVDGSRGLKFHGGKEEPFRLQWKEGDRLGCWLDTKEGVIRYSVNGGDTEEAFVIPSKKDLPLVPALSCNQGEILHLHTTKSDCKFFPKLDAIAVGDLVDEIEFPSEQNTIDNAQEPIGKPSPKRAAINDKRNSGPVPGPMIQEQHNATKAKFVEPEPLDLTPFQSAVELEALGLDRLKSALMALQVKCGGSLSERATRLFSLKGVARHEYPRKVRSKHFTA